MAGRFLFRTKQRNVKPQNGNRWFYRPASRSRHACQNRVKLSPHYIIAAVNMVTNKYGLSFWRKRLEYLRVGVATCLGVWRSARIPAEHSWAKFIDDAWNPRGSQGADSKGHEIAPRRLTRADASAIHARRLFTVPRFRGDSAVGCQIEPRGAHPVSLLSLVKQ
jgi:hypothetical protein